MPVRGELVEILFLPAVPVHQNLLLRSQAEALACRRADIALVQCVACSFVFNAAFDETLMSYSPEYDSSQSHSPAFSRYLDVLVEELIQRHGLRGKTILEIGCGQGDFLARLCQAGGNTGLGLDPSHPGDGHGARPNVTILRERYPSPRVDVKADMICARHVIEHVARPATLIEAIRAAIGERSDTLVWFETPRLEWIVEHLAFWDICYEHCSYFTRSALTHLFERCSFATHDSRATFGGQYQWLEARPRSSGAPPPLSRKTMDRLVADIRAFATRWAARRAEWRERIAGLARDGGCVVWGAGAKGVSFLNALMFDHTTVPVVVDVNPRKQGGYVPGTGQPVIAPTGLRDYQARTVLVMNPNYVDEVRAMLRTQGRLVEVLSL